MENIRAFEVSQFADDFTARPQWPFSSYTPSKNLPVQLLDASDIQPEELHLQYYQAASQGNLEQIHQDVLRLVNYEQVKFGILERYVTDATDYINIAQRSNYNKYDASTSQDIKPPTFLEYLVSLNKTGDSPINIPELESSSQALKTSLTSGDPPAVAVHSQNSAFGSFVADHSTFGHGAAGKSSFGQPSSVQSAVVHSAFGQPASGRPAFGQPASGQPAFGQPAFGQLAFAPSAPRQPAFAQPAFGQPTFAQPAFGQPAFGQPVFGQSTSVQRDDQKAVFGQSALKQPASIQPAFGRPAFGQTAGGGLNSVMNGQDIHSVGQTKTVQPAFTASAFTTSASTNEASSHKIFEKPSLLENIQASDTNNMLSLGPRRSDSGNFEYHGDEQHSHNEGQKTIENKIMTTALNLGFHNTPTSLITTNSSSSGNADSTNVSTKKDATGLTGSKSSILKSFVNPWEKYEMVTIPKSLFSIETFNDDPLASYTAMDLKIYQDPIYVAGRIALLAPTPELALGSSQH